jgi:tRNA 2-thiouridine synthesizing protein E
MEITNDSFPNAPAGWDIETAKTIAKEDGVNMTDEHWELVQALQEYYNKVEFPHLRQIKDALDEKFHSRGGMKYLYEIIPGGPVAQGCKLAGLNVPSGAIDKSFGSVA